MKKRPLKFPDARTAIEYGSPPFDELDAVRGLGGDRGAVLDMVWGRTDAEWNETIDYEVAAECRDRPHVFVEKLKPRRPRRKTP